MFATATAAVDVPSEPRAPRKHGALYAQQAEWVRRGDRQSLDLLVRSMERYVWKRAAGWQRTRGGRVCDLDDLIAEGRLGVLRAVGIRLSDRQEEDEDGEVTSKFDPDRGFAFCTYATYWIDQFIRRFISNHSRTIGVPVWLTEKKLRNAAIERAGGAGTAKGAALIATAAKIASFDAPLPHLSRGDDNVTLLDLTADSAANAEDRLVADAEHRERAVLLGRAMSQARLNPREQQVLAGVLAGRTLEAISKEIPSPHGGPIVRERVRQILVKASHRIERQLRRMGVDADMTAALRFARAGTRRVDDAELSDGALRRRVAEANRVGSGGPSPGAEPAPPPAKEIDDMGGRTGGGQRVLATMAKAPARFFTADDLTAVYGGTRDGLVVFLCKQARAGKVERGMKGSYRFKGPATAPGKANPAAPPVSDAPRPTRPPAPIARPVSPIEPQARVPLQEVRSASAKPRPAPEPKEAELADQIARQASIDRRTLGKLRWALDGAEQGFLSLDQLWEIRHSPDVARLLA